MIRQSLSVHREWVSRSLLASYSVALLWWRNHVPRVVKGLLDDCRCVSA